MRPITPWAKWLKEKHQCEKSGQSLAHGYKITKLLCVVCFFLFVCFFTSVQSHPDKTIQMESLCGVIQENGRIKLKIMNITIVFLEYFKESCTKDKNSEMGHCRNIESRMVFLF